jgi:hypothetical protein
LQNSILIAIKRQGTTSVVPKEQQKVNWALAPAILFLVSYNSAAAKAGIVFGPTRYD